MRIRDLLEEKYKSGSVQVNITGPVAKTMLKMGKAIPKRCLTEDGREDEPHITVRFGLTGSADSVKSALAEFGPIRAYMVGMGHFESPDNDVIFIKIDSPDLKRANKLLGERCDYLPEDYSYKPHATIAYVKTGMGKILEEAISLSSQIELIFDKVFVSDRNGNKIPISLV